MGQLTRTTYSYDTLHLVPKCSCGGLPHAPNASFAPISKSPRVRQPPRKVSKRQKKKREELPLAPAPARPSNVTETPDTDGDDHGREPRVAGEPAPTVPPLTMAERRARKAEARAARIEAALLKKEAAARDARSKELDLQDDSKKFTVKVSTWMAGALGGR